MSALWMSEFEKKRPGSGCQQSTNVTVIRKRFSFSHTVFFATNWTWLSALFHAISKSCHHRTFHKFSAQWNCTERIWKTDAPIFAAAVRLRKSHGERKSFLPHFKAIKTPCWLFLTLRLSPLPSTICFYALSAILCCTCVMKCEKCRGQWTWRGGGECEIHKNLHMSARHMENGKTVDMNDDKTLQWLHVIHVIHVINAVKCREINLHKLETFCDVRQSAKISIDLDCLSNWGYLERKDNNGI